MIEYLVENYCFVGPCLLAAAIAFGFIGDRVYVPPGQDDRSRNAGRRR